MNTVIPEETKSTTLVGGVSVLGHYNPLTLRDTSKA